jgi:hypothetical protein
VGGPAGPQVEGGLVDPDGDDDDGLVTEPTRAQLGLQPGQQPLGGVAGDAQVEHGVGREGGGADGDGGVLVETAAQPLGPAALEVDVPLGDAVTEAQDRRHRSSPG